MYGIATRQEADGHRPHVGKALLAGLIGGLVGTGVKTICELLVPPRPPGAESPLGVGIRMINTHFTGHDLDEGHKYVAEKIVHWAFGTFTGGLYGVIAEFLPVATIGYGVAFGIAFWISAHEIFLPLVGWSPSPLQMTAWEQGNEFVSHCFFGVAVELVRRGVRRGYDAAARQPGRANRITALRRRAVRPADLRCGEVGGASRDRHDRSSSI